MLSTMCYDMSTSLNSRICRTLYTNAIVSSWREDFSLKRFTTSSSSFINISVDKIELPSQKHFLLCETCFWCASHINIHKRMITECPSCNSLKLESMPICDKEVYRFDYHPKRGVTLEFWKIVEAKGIER
jgi:hypothetical protein